MPTLFYHYVVVKHTQHVQYGTAAPSVFCAAGDVGMYFVMCIGWTGFSLDKVQPPRTMSNAVSPSIVSVRAHKIQRSLIRWPVNGP